MPETNEKGQELYRGLKSYEKYNPGRSLKHKNSKEKPSKFLGIGPQRAPDNVKITCRFDYQPDVCKDWKETGYCGYGASCKFLHDRSDYKSGWQIEKEWNEAQQRKKEKLAMKNRGLNGNNNNNNDDDEENWEIHSSDEDSDIDADGLPFACYICRNEFNDPVMTPCGHYFCESCAFKRYKKSQMCAVCGENTNGQFQTAQKLIKKLNKKHKQAS